MATELDTGVEEAVLEKGVRKNDGDMALLAHQTILFDINDLSQMFIPTPPIDWRPVVVKAESDEPVFCQLNDSGGWNDYFFHPRFNKKAKGEKYMYHTLLIEAQPVPLDSVSGQ